LAVFGRLRGFLSRDGGGEGSLTAFFHSYSSKGGFQALGPRWTGGRAPAGASPCLAGLGLLYDGLQVGLPFLIVPKGVYGIKVAFELLEFGDIGSRSAIPGARSAFGVGCHQLSSFPGQCRPALCWRDPRGKGRERISGISAIRVFETPAFSCGKTDHHQEHRFGIVGE
jgi:hypothetical protein